MNVIGTVNDAPEATLPGRAAPPHWKIEEAIVQVGFVIAVFALHVTWIVDV